MAEAAPHHLELIYQLLVQGTHLWVHQLLVHGQADSENVNLWENNQTSLDNTFIVWTEWMSLSFLKYLSCNKTSGQFFVHKKISKSNEFLRFLNFLCLSFNIKC